MNPYDMDDVASAIHRAYTMEEKERRRRMVHLREQVRDWDIHWGVRTFLEAAQGRDLGPDQDLHLPRYIPAWDLRCHVREHLLDWIQKEHPESLPRLRAELERIPQKEKGN